MNFSIDHTLSQVLRILPFSLTKLLTRLGENLRLHRIACKSLRDRDITIINGVGAGLKFNIGVSNPDYALGINELPVQQALDDHIKFGGTVYDIGANIGFFTIIAARLVGQSGHVYAFEPVSENVINIQRNVNLNRYANVTVFENAVSRSTGKGELLLTKHPGGHTLSSAGNPHNVVRSITVDLVSIDDMISKKTIKPPEVVKIDVEGAEIGVLQGMKQTIKQYRPIIIYEIDDRDIEAFEKKQKIINKFLKSFKYQIKTLEESYKEISCIVGHAIALPDNTHEI